MQSVTSVLRVVVAITALAMIAACGGGNASPAPGTTPPTTPPANGVVQVTGSENMGWDQSAASVADLQSLSYRVFVDGVVGNLARTSCSFAASPAGYPCNAPLPPLTTGQHTLQLAAVRTQDGVTLQSELSDPLIVFKVVSPNSISSAQAVDPRNTRKPGSMAGNGTSSTAASPDRREEQRVAVISDQLHAPTAIAPAPDGRVFVAEPDRILVIENGVLRADPSLMLNESGVPGEAGLPDLTLDRAFAANHILWSSQVVEDGSRRVVRVMRYTEASGTLGESAVVAELPVGDTVGRTRIRVGPDARLYISISDSSAVGARDSVYEGSIVRLERDGTTPRDNPSGGPVLSAGHGNLRAIGWPSGSTDLWDLVTRDGKSTIEAVSLSARSLQTGRMSVAVSRRFSLAAPDLTALEFVEDATPLTAVTASPQQQSIYRLTWPNDTLATPVPMLAGRFGSIREVAVAPDGSIYATTANQPGSDTRRGDLLIRVIPR